MLKTTPSFRTTMLNWYVEQQYRVDSLRKSPLQIEDYVKNHRDASFPSVRFVRVPSAARCGHNHIYLYQKFQEIVR